MASFTRLFLFYITTSLVRILSLELALDSFLTITYRLRKLYCKLPVCLS